HGEGLEVGLDAGAAAGIGSGDDQDSAQALHGRGLARHGTARKARRTFVVAQRACAIAAQTRSAWTVSRTSWTRTAATPWATPARAPAMEPPKRWSAGTFPPSKAPMNLLRLTPSRPGKPRPTIRSRPASRRRLWRIMCLPKP